jgi:hypothetical protein
VFELLRLQLGQSVDWSLKGPDCLKKGKDMPHNRSNIALACALIVLAGVGCAPSARFTLYSNSNNPGYPSVHDGLITLTPEENYGASGVAFMKKGVPAPFILSFEFAIWDSDGATGMTHWNSADGINVMVGTDESVYAETEPPSGSDLAYVSEAGGHRLLFKTYGSRKIELANATSVLAEVFEPRVYTAGEWQAVQLEVTKTGITLRFDDRTVLKWQGDIQPGELSVAFGAATGGANSRHQVRNVVVTPLANN